MKQVFKTEQGFLVLDAPEPVLQEDGVLVRVERSLISPGTETSGTSLERGAAKASLMDSLKEKAELAKRGFSSLATRGFQKTWESTRAHFQQQAARTHTGYSCAGVVIASRGEGVPPKGARVACAGAGIANHAEVVSVPKNLCALVPESLSWDEAAYATLGAIALHGVRRAEAQPGESAVVLGLGLVGLLVLQLARASGLRTIAIDLDPARVERARALGAEVAFALSTEKDVVALVRQATQGAGADRVLLCHASNSSDATNLGVKMCRRKGRVVVVGVFGLDIEREPFFKGEVDLVISTSYGPGRYDRSYEEKGHDYPSEHVRWTEQRNLEEFLRLVSRKEVDVCSLTDRTFPLEDASKAFEVFSTATPRPVGVLLTYPKKEERKVEAALPVLGSAERRAKTVALIGAGEFMLAVHGPLLLARGFEVAVVANRTLASAERAARLCGDFPDKSPERSKTKALVDWRRALEEPSVGLVVVATRHDSHAEIAAAALDAGKHVLLEKPAATTREGLELLRAARERRKDLVLAIGHNRRFSPLARSLKEKLGKGGPRVLSYRINAPFVPAGSWLQDPVQGAGRIVGEGTHFLDLLAFLTGDPSPELVEAFAQPVDGERVCARDSYVALLRFKNGAIATLAYTSQGASGLGKERLEASTDGASFVLDDFRSLTGSEPLAEPDKGHARLWDELEKALSGAPSLIPPAEDAFLATETALRIEERIRGLPAS